jgi:hypothetical protein
MKRNQNDLLTLLPRGLFARLLNRFLTLSEWQNLRATSGLLQNYVNSHELEYLSDLYSSSQFAALCRLVLHINQIPMFYDGSRISDEDTATPPDVGVVTALQNFTDRVFLCPEVAALSLSCLSRLQPLNSEQQQTLENAEMLLPPLLLRSLEALRQKNSSLALAPCTLEELSSSRTGAEMRLAAHVLGVSARHTLENLLAINFNQHVDRHDREWIFGMLVSMGTLEDQKKIFTDLIAPAPPSREGKNRQYRRRESVLTTLSSAAALSFLPAFIESPYFDRFNLHLLISRLNSGDSICALPRLIRKFEDSPEHSDTALQEIGLRAAREGTSVPMHIRRDILSALTKLAAQASADITETIWPLILMGLGSFDEQIVAEALLILEKGRYPLNDNQVNQVFNTLIKPKEKELKKLIGGLTRFFKVTKLTAFLNLTMLNQLDKMIVTELEKIRDARISDMKPRFVVDQNDHALLERMHAIIELLTEMRKHSLAAATHTVHPTLSLIAPWLLKNKDSLRLSHLYSKCFDFIIGTLPLIDSCIQPLLEHALNPNKPIPDQALPIMTLVEGGLSRSVTKQLCSQLSIVQARSLWPAVLAAGYAKNSVRKEVIAIIAIEIFTLLKKEIAEEAVQFFAFLLTDPATRWWSDLCPVIHVIAQRARHLAPIKFTETFDFLRVLSFQTTGLYNFKAIIALKSLIPYYTVDQLKRVLLDMKALLKIPYEKDVVNDTTISQRIEAIRTIAAISAILTPKPDPKINDTFNDSLRLIFDQLDSPYLAIFKAAHKAIPHLVNHCSDYELRSNLVRRLLRLISNPPQARNFFGLGKFPNISRLSLKILTCLVRGLELSDIKNLLQTLNDPALIKNESAKIAEVLNALLKHLKATNNEVALKEFKLYRSLRVLCGTQIPVGRNSIFTELSAALPPSKSLKLEPSNEPVLRYADLRKPN